jgi:cation:H+ antiporter
MNNYVSLALGVLAAGVGGELFVRGSVGVAQWARVSPGIIGATLAAFATSSPELSVSINAASTGSPEISLGDVLGSNVVNVAIILGVALSISDIRCPRSVIRRDFPFAIIVPVVTGMLMLDGVLSRVDGILLLCVFVFWLVATTIEAVRQRNEASDVLGEHRHGRAVLSGLVGLALLFGAGYFIVRVAKGIATDYGLDPFIIGATVVAVGTSVPELATTLVSKLRGHDEVGLGTVLGSNIFNGLLIVSVAAILCPIVIRWREVLIALIFGILSVAITYPSRSGVIERRRGLLLLVLYVVYLVALMQNRTA